MNAHLTMILTCVFYLILGIFLGNGAVYFFNKMPGKWLVDYGQEPDEELLHPTCQRVKSTPWKYVFTGFFIVVGIAMATDDPYYAFAAVFALWLRTQLQRTVRNIDKIALFSGDNIIMPLIMSRH